MDHLLSSSGGEHILVPYVGVEEYDGGDFKAYWQRKGWRRTERGDLIFEDRTPHEKAAFFQTWLYFGCLISVFGCHGNQIPYLVRGPYSNLLCPT
jgi:hypothetical protein